MTKTNTVVTINSIIQAIDLMSGLPEQSELFYIDGYDIMDCENEHNRETVTDSNICFYYYSNSDDIILVSCTEQVIIDYLLQYSLNSRNITSIM